MADVAQKVTNIVLELMDVPESEVMPSTRFREDLEMDSLDLVELIQALEDEFDSEIADEEMQKITTVEQAVSYIQTTLSAAA